MKAVEAAFNQEKALVAAFSVIVQLCRLIVYSTRERGSGAIYDPRDNVSDRVVPVHADTGAVGIWWPSVTSGITKLLYRFTILYYLFYFYVTFRKDIDSMESHVLFIVSYCHLMIVGIQGK